MRRLVLAVLALVAVLAAPAAADSSALPGVAGEPTTLGGVPCFTIAGPTALPIGRPACSGIRPGGVVTTATQVCTLNFVFRGVDSRGRRSTLIGTAGHCVLPENSERVWAKGHGPAAYDATGHRFGEFAYAVHKDPKDFALIRVDGGVPVSPQMCHFGGPTGIESRIVRGKVIPLHYYGDGVLIGKVYPGFVNVDTLPARSAVVYGLPDRDHVYATGAITLGDSGAGIITGDGRALGVIVTVGAHSSGFSSSYVDAGTIGITRLPPQVRRAETKLKLDLTLQTAKLL